MTLDIWREVFAERAEQERWLSHKHPWYGIAMNWFGAVLLAILLVASVVMMVKANTERKAAEMTATAIAEMEAARQAEADAEKQSQDYILRQEATEVAKALYGIHLFIDKYNYNEQDLITYVRCMTNRAEASGCSLQEVIRTEGQFLGYYEKNPVLDEFYNLALRLVTAWHTETTKPIDSSYQFAELNDDGIYLRNRYIADGYAKRWQA